MAESSSSPAWAEHPDLVAFYTEHRGRPEDLYPSEARFLPWLAARAASVLDTGCAAGGFSGIWRHYRPGIRYTGVDLSASLIEAAKQRHPGDTFLQGNVTEGLALPDGYAEVVQALGWLNWEPAYEQAIRELWGLASRYLFLDVRLAPEASQAAVGRQQLALAGAWDGATTTPYVVVGWPSFAALLNQLQPAAILGCGYWGPPAKTVRGIAGPVCFGSFVLKRPRGGQSGARTVCLDLPLAWPQQLAAGAQVFPGAQLDAMLRVMR